MNYTDEQKRTALMLCIFGGWLGLHRFYLKKYVSGTIYLLTMGGFFVGWFIDIYQIATGKMFNDIEIKENSKDLNYYGGKKRIKTSIFYFKRWRASAVYYNRTDGCKYMDDCMY